MSNIFIRDGKFYKDGVEVKPEFGNLEQIRALQAELRRANEKKIEAKLYQEEVSQYYASVKFTCPSCKNENHVDVLEDDPLDMHVDNSDVDGYDISCNHCDADFTIEADKTQRGNMGIVLVYDPE
jgi:transcription elongation factor Elf1